MTALPDYMIYVLVFGGMAVLLSAFACFDYLVRWEYQHHRDHWDADGKPDGFFWRAPECKFWSSDIAKKRLSFRWLFRTPPWAREATVCRRCLFGLRTLVLLWNAAILSVGLYCVLHSLR
jgi:hypothetical protein